MSFLPQIPPPSPTLYKASSRVSNDVVIQKFHRLRTVFEATRKDMDLNDEGMTATIPEVESLIKNLERLCRREAFLRHERTGWGERVARVSGLFWALCSRRWARFRLILVGRSRRQALYGRTVREIHHATHDLHMRLITIQPVTNLEAAFHTHLHDLKAVTDEITFKELTDTPLGRSVKEIVERKNSGCPVHHEGTLPHKTSDYLADLRAYSLQIINETRRQQLTKRQIEVIRDEVTTVLFRASARLLVCVAVVFTAFQWSVTHWSPWQDAESAMTEWPSIFTTEVPQPYFAAIIGGIFGAFFSALSRIGQISESGVTQGNLSVLAGAGRPIYHAPALGCMAAGVVYLLFALAGFSNVGPFHIPSPTDGNGNGAGSKIGIAFLIGMIAGFSERLIPDIIDGFKKKPSS